MVCDTSTDYKKVLCGIIAFARGLSLAGVIAFIQAVLFTSSWLLGMEIIKYSIAKMLKII